MEKETLEAIEEFLACVADAYDERGCLLRRYRVHDNEIGSGSARVVILYEFDSVKVAIKFVHHKRMGDNLTEWRAWHTMPQSIREMTAQPYAISECNRVIAFEYVPQTARQFLGDPVIDQRVIQFNKRLRRLFEEAEYEANEIDRLLRDNKPDNIGIRPDGSLVWIDFASFL